MAWILHVDGASNSSRNGEGLILASLNGFVIKYVLRFAFQTSNNQAKYEALLARLRMLKEVGVKELKTLVDSQLVVN